VNLGVEAARHGIEVRSAGNVLAIDPQCAGGTKVDRIGGSHKPVQHASIQVFVARWKVQTRLQIASRWPRRRVEVHELQRRSDAVRRHHVITARLYRLPHFEGS
jgi:hypothetical protein